jgi:hypothetical protein
VSERRYWVGVAARDHVVRGVAESFCQFAHGDHKAAGRLAVDDRFAYYAPMTGIRIGDPVRRFVALGRTLDAPAVEAQMTPEVTGWRRSAAYYDAIEADIYPLLPRLSFVRDPAHWGMAFRKSLFPVNEADFAIIAEAMQAPAALH